jgi:hypothetical protein
MDHGIGERIEVEQQVDQIFHGDEEGVVLELTMINNTNQETA